MVVILTSDEIMERGLEIVGFQVDRQTSVRRKQNVERFVTEFGSNPLVVAQVWYDLQTTNIPDARIYAKRSKDVDNLLMAMFFMKGNAKRSTIAGRFGVCEKTVDNRLWKYCGYIQALKAEKIVWPESWTPGAANMTDDTFLISVDGVHCRINEPKHPTYSKNKAYYSHKFRQAGLDYEIGISLFTSDVVWVNGPFRAGKNDITIFREDGLKDMIPEGKRIIGDKGYRGEKGIITTPNAHYPKHIQQFISRALARHESFNKKLKHFDTLAARFRNSIAKHKTVFEAICVICQYQVEHGTPLFEN